MAAINKLSFVNSITWFFIFFYLSVMVFSTRVLSQESMDVGQFTQTGSALEPWQIVRFDKKVPATSFAWIEWQGLVALEAKADDSMALMARPIEFSLKEFPVLCWQWWVDETLKKADLKKKKGDDYAARLYLTFDLPDDKISWGLSLKLSLARSLYGDQVPEAAINYIWDNKYPIDTKRSNAYTEQAYMVVLQSGDEKSKQWIQQKRHVYNDLIALFDAKKAKLIQLAVASDTDNTKGKARALFADFHFIREGDECQWSVPKAQSTTPEIKEVGLQSTATQSDTVNF